jgi:hypothetical protein
MPRSSAAPIVNVLRLSGFPLLRQLWLEEALFRSHPGNWFVINDGVPDPTIVLGISGYVIFFTSPFFPFYKDRCMTQQHNTSISNDLIVLYFQMQ